MKRNCEISIDKSAEEWYYIIYIKGISVPCARFLLNFWVKSGTNKTGHVTAIPKGGGI